MCISLLEKNMNEKKRVETLRKQIPEENVPELALNSAAHIIAYERRKGSSDLQLKESASPNLLIKNFCRSYIFRKELSFVPYPAESELNKKIMKLNNC